MISQERIISISTLTIFKVVVTVLALMFLWAIRDILALVLAALILSALINPFANWGKHHHIPKGITVVLFYVIVFGGLLSAFALALPQVIDQIGHLGSTLDRSWQALSSEVAAVKQFGAQYGLTQNFQVGVTSLQGQAASIIGKLFSTLTGVFGGLVSLVLVLVMTFYMVVQGEDSLRWLKGFMTEEYQRLSTSLFVRVQEQFGRWLLGQLALMAIMGVFIFLGLSLIGVEGALIIAILSGFTEFIPYLGPILSAIPAVIIALAQSPALAVFTIILFVLAHQIENHILVPKIMQKAVGLNPVVSIVALLVGGKLFGMAGAILAIPVMTVVSVAFMEIQRFRQERDGARGA
jgi:predicted PurR-regulated permease PerM